MERDQNREIKAIAKAMLYFDIGETASYPMIVSHPFTNCGYVMTKGSNQLIDITTDKEGMNRWRKEIADIIDSEHTTIHKIMNMMNKSYRLYFLYKCMEYITPSEMGSLLSEAWVSVEFPMQNNNSESILEMFKYADKDNLMSNKEKQVLNSQGDIIQIFRGTSGDSEAALYGVSWTLNINIAKWFANRFKEGGIVYSMTISKKDVIAYFERRNEQEIIIDPAIINEHEVKSRKI